jgi:hypothetical protein
VAEVSYNNFGSGSAKEGHQEGEDKNGSSCRGQDNISFMKEKQSRKRES